MKKIIFLAAIMTSVSGFAAQNLCGVTVQQDAIIRVSGLKYSSVNLVRELMKADNAIITECFNADGAVLVGEFPNGEVRATIF